MAEIRISGGKSYTEIPDLDMFKMHTHDTHEIYCFLSGNAKYFVEGTVYTLHSGDILIMKTGEAHSLLIDRPTPYERIVINFNEAALIDSSLADFLNNRPLGQGNCYSASVFHNKPWQYYLSRIYSSEDMQKKQLYLNVLLNELKESTAQIKTVSHPKNSIIEIIEYINGNLSKELSLDGICARFFISKTNLNRKFKSITGSTVWEYITTKRLILAKQLLSTGIRPTEVFFKCGFNDYCSFFRAYKLKFGVSPKEDYKN